MEDSWEMRLSDLFDDFDTLERSEDDNLPMVTSESLKIYFNYLKRKLVFPFAAFYEQEIAPFSTERHDVTVTGIEEFSDEEYGVFCSIKSGRKKGSIPLGELEVDSNAPYYQFVDDYNTWFWNYR